MLGSPLVVGDAVQPFLLAQRVDVEDVDPVAEERIRPVATGASSPFRLSRNRVDRKSPEVLLDLFGAELVKAKKVLAVYPGETKQELKAAGSEFVTDAWFVQPARQLLDGRVPEFFR